MMIGKDAMARSMRVQPRPMANDGGLDLDARKRRILRRGAIGNSASPASQTGLADGGTIQRVAMVAAQMKRFYRGQAHVDGAVRRKRHVHSQMPDNRQRHDTCVNLPQLRFVEPLSVGSRPSGRGRNVNSREFFEKFHHEGNSLIAGRLVDAAPVASRPA